MTSKWEIQLKAQGRIAYSLRQGEYGTIGANFTFVGIDQTPFQIEITAAGFRHYTSPPVQLEPGELRFLHLRLEPR